MTRSRDSEVRVVVCGSNYGAMYALALSTLPGFRLTGVVARGSPRSVNLAKTMGVPLYTSPAEEASPVDIACVAVGGGAANELILSFLRRGVHVLAEHPIGPGAAEAALTAARQSGSASQMVPLMRALASRLPLANERSVSSKPSGSTT